MGEKMIEFQYWIVEPGTCYVSFREFIFQNRDIEIAKSVLNRFTTNN